jgi:hypothetical protein
MGGSARRANADTTIGEVMGPSTTRGIEAAKPKESFSQLIARILDQLSLRPPEVGRERLLKS